MVYLHSPCTFDELAFVALSKRFPFYPSPFSTILSLVEYIVILDVDYIARPYHVVNCTACLSRRP